MPLHPQVAALLEAMSSLGAPPIEESTPEAVRAARAAMARPSDEHVHEIRDVDADGVPCRLYRPRADDGLGLLVFLHGGGWVIGDLDSHDPVCRSLANMSGHAVLSVGYRLAPEHRFPAALDDSLVAVRWAHEHAPELGCRADRLAIGGDSAGGNLAAVIAQQAPVPLVFQLLVYPVTDCTRSLPSYEQNGTGYFLTKAGMGWFIDHYLGSGASTHDDLRVSPLHAPDHVLAETPPALVITAEFDPLRDEGDAYADRLAACGVPTSHVRFGGMIHGFFSLAGLVDDATGANALAGTALRSAFDRVP